MKDVHVSRECKLVDSVLAKKKSILVAVQPVPCTRRLAAYNKHAASLKDNSSIFIH